MRALLALGMLLVCGFPVALQAAESRPNILLILTDDLGNNDIGAWGDGEAKTPTIDALSQQSIRFRQHYVDSTCSVSRAALLTGRAPVSIGFEPDGMGLSPDLPTLPKALKQLGYATHHLGKWHVGEALEYPQIEPGHQGFDDWLGMMNHFVLQGPGPDGKPLGRRPTYYDPWLQENGAAPVQHKGHLDDLLTDRAVSLIEHPTSPAPWFINLWLLSPHNPIQPSQEFAAKYPNTPEGKYLALLAQLDRNVARLLDALERSGQADRTIVVFASDNGSPNGNNRNSNYPLLGTKVTYLEGGVRTPLLIRWPGHAGNRDVTVATHEIDLFPTLVAMAGGKAPTGLDGRNLQPYLQRGATVRPLDLFWAADNPAHGMTYGGHLPGKGLFYRDWMGGLQSAAVTGPLLPKLPRNTAHQTFSRAQSSALIRQWELKHRPIPLIWTEASGASPATLSGRDLQRAPVLAGYALGMGLGRAQLDHPQTLLEQPGMWKVAVDGAGTIRVEHSGKQLIGQPITLDRTCNALVTTAYIHPFATFPFPSQASARLVVYLNGKVVLESNEVIGRPADPAVLAHPTIIGAAADGSERFAGKISRPVLVGKLLLPEQEGYRLADMEQAVCR
ncbi:sulfatase family protein [Pseudomonas nitroreducens]|uniref:sulfatase family protein n=1 Tax=Pseudomonas nitroreducens TaxID=46680 RepID=UPI002659C230|nr:sulfatase-like hydrolase/transferase [Pseudomonas nitroreducens]MCP1648308.1 arylsulfatase A-like enzyme [Pseudomonas nitroreducens]MCP1686883.1 arylsulfatase A-like enzyme [Pseudomonas nitroreducens]